MDLAGRIDDDAPLLERDRPMGVDAGRPDSAGMENQLQAFM
jgi:hypothetical protein